MAKEQLMSLLSIQYVAFKQRVHAEIQLPIYNVRGSTHSEPLVLPIYVGIIPFDTENSMLSFHETSETSAETSEDSFVRLFAQGAAWHILYPPLSWNRDRLTQD